MEKDKKRILLVEDEQTLANLIELRLERAGYKVEVARDGKKGLELILEQKAELILLDLMLPELGGFDILEELARKNILPDLPIVIISNSGQPVEVERAIKLGVRDYLIKVNFSPDEVLEKVNQVIASEEAKRKGKRSNKFPGVSKALLLIEDDKILGDVLERKFTRAKHQVFKALNAGEARNILQKEKISLILLDLVLPDVDGYSFLAELKKGERTKDIPVIIISNLGQRQEIKKGMDAGAVDYIVKSDTVPEEILKKVEAVLQKGQNKK